jgi:hypothetical protein
MLIWRNTMRGLCAALMALALAACAGIGLPSMGGTPVSAPFDQRAYENAVNVRARALVLIDRAGEKYATRRPEVEALMVEVDTAYTYVQSRPGNQIAIQAWERIRNPQGGSLANYLLRWRERGALSPAVRNERRAQIAAHLEYVVCIEANKQAEIGCSNPGF